jgi:hypothetical protein
LPKEVASSSFQLIIQIKAGDSTERGEKSRGFEKTSAPHSSYTILHDNGEIDCVSLLASRNVSSFESNETDHE